MRRAAEISKLPEGVFSLLIGSGREVGSALVQHPAIKAVGFTGSTSGGTALMKLAADRAEPIPVYAEMGSVNPVFLLPGALKGDVRKLAIGLRASATMGVGQFCTNPGIVLVPSGESGPALIDAFASLMRASADAIMLNASIHAAFCSAVDERVGHAKVKTLVAHGGPFPATSDGRSTSVGTLAIECFVRLIAYQSCPQAALPPELRDGNPLGITRLVDGAFSKS